MNIFSYFVLGAAIGSLLAAKKIGNKALIVGGLCALLPSLDHLIAMLFSVPDSLYINAGVTHSIIFCVLAAPILGWLLHKFVTTDLTIVEWSKLAFSAMVAHCVFDVFKIRGCGLLEPFIHKRFALAIISDHDILVAVLYHLLKRELGYRYNNHGNVVFAQCAFREKIVYKAVDTRWTCVLVFCNACFCSRKHASFGFGI